MANKNKELRKALSGEEVTLEMLQEAQKIYKEIAQESYQSEDWTEFQLAVINMNRGFFKYLDANKDKLDDYIKLIFVNENNTFNASLSVENKDGSIDNLVSIKVKSHNTLSRLLKDYDFFLYDE